MSKRHWTNQDLLNDKDEHAEQVDFITRLRGAWPDIWVFAIPNAGKRPGRRGKRLVREGMEEGVPDLCIPAFRVFVEMKRKDASPSEFKPKQREWVAYLNRWGFKAYVAHGADDAWQQLVSHLIDNGVNLAGLSSQDDLGGLIHEDLAEIYEKATYSRIQDIKERLSKVLSGRWACSLGVQEVFGKAKTKFKRVLFLDDKKSKVADKNAFEFINRAPEDIPFLLSEIERLHNKRANREAAIER